MLGSNECDSLVPLAQIKFEMDQFYRRIQSLLPNTIIIASQIEARLLPAISNYESRAKKLNAWLRVNCIKDHLLVLGGKGGVEEHHYESDGFRWSRAGCMHILTKIARSIRCIEGKRGRYMKGIKKNDIDSLRH